MRKRRRFTSSSNVSFQERRPRTLKSGYTFALFDHRGDIVAGEGNSDGIYLHDTRFLSQLELRLNGAPLLLLSSNVQEDNAVLTVDLANPELISRDGVALARRTDPCEPAQIHLAERVLRAAPRPQLRHPSP